MPTIANPNFAIGVEALQSRLGGDGYKLLLASSNYDANLEEQQVGSLLAHGVDGVMLVGGAHNQNLINLLRSKNVPFVCSWASDLVLPSVGFDNYASARLLANYLMDLGHLDIGVIAGITRGNDRAAARVAGIRDALRERQLALPRERLTECSYRIVDGQIGLGGLLAQDPWPTAVICGNDVLAFGVLVECQKRGIHVPTQLSVASFDDLEFAAQLNPPLTTLRIPAAEIGARAAEYLMALIAGTVVPLTVDVSVNLIVRGSTAPPRQGRRR